MSLVSQHSKIQSYTRTHKRTCQRTLGTQASKRHCLPTMWYLGYTRPHHPLLRTRVPPRRVDLFRILSLQNVHPAIKCNRNQSL